MCDCLRVLFLFNRKEREWYMTEMLSMKNWMEVNGLKPEFSDGNLVIKINHNASSLWRITYMIAIMDRKDI